MASLFFIGVRPQVHFWVVLRNIAEVFKSTRRGMRDLSVMKMLRNFLALAVLVTLSACGGGSPLTLTQENLDKVQEGMSAAQVQTILGAPTDSKSEPIPIVGGTKTTYVYTNKTDRVVIVLKNDTVQSKEGHFTSEKK